MNVELLMTFIVFNVINVVIQTVKSIATIKCGKTAAAGVNALAYGLYTYVVVLTMCDLPLLWKCIIVALTNFVGVWVVKFAEEKARKDKIWKIELTVPIDRVGLVKDELEKIGISYNYIEGIGKYNIVNCYCATQSESAFVKSITEVLKIKYFVSETKNL